MLPSKSHFPVHLMIVVGLMLFSVAMSALVSRAVFERLPHLEDEVAYLFQAKTYARGQLVVDTPEPRRAYWQPFVVDYAPTGNRFSKYSPGWPAFLALGVLMGQPWIVNALMSGLTVALVYRLGREIYGADVGTAAAALTAFSPMALLLNGTLMGHTSALFTVMLFIYGYWRMEGGKNIRRWAVIAGVGLGLTIINRPLTAVGIAVPFVVWSVIRLVSAVYRKSDLPDRSYKTRLFEVAQPLIILTVVALLISAAIPIYNYAATGKPTQNLYTLVWPYDRVGFGAAGEYGRSGHTLEKGIRHVRFDLSLMAADLYGWQLGAVTPQLQEHLRTESGYWPVIGLSWVLLPFGLLIGARQRWTWLLAGLAAGLILTHLAYWIGSQRYSTRYYFETLGALAILSAIPVAWFIRYTGQRWLTYGLLALLLVASLYNYSTPRIMALYRFNFIGQHQIDAVEERREGDRAALVLVTGADVRWRAMGALMSVTSPLLDSEIVVAWDNLERGVREAILARFPDRQIIEMQAEGNQAWFKEQSG